MKKNQEGIILLVTLLLLGVVSVLILAQLEMVLLHQKASTQFFTGQQSRHNLEQIAWEIMDSFRPNEQLNCTIMAFQNPNSAMTYLKSKRACSVTRNKTTVDFLIEDLGVESCLQVFVNKVLYSTRHWRLTLAEEGAVSDYLQIRVAELSDLERCSNKTALRIRAGLMSVRFGTLI